MKPTTKILSVLLATQIAFSCFADAVESTKTTVQSTTQPAVSTTKSAIKKPSKKKLISKKKMTEKAKKTVTIKKSKTPVSITTTSTTDPKEAIETEIDTIDKMEAAAAAESKAAQSNTGITTATAVKPNSTSPTATSTTGKPAPADTSWLKANITLGSSYNMAAEAPKEGVQNRYMDYDIIPSLVTGPVKTLLWFKYRQSLVNSEQNEWQNFPIVFSPAKAFNAGDYLTISPALAFTIPLTKETKNNIQLNYSTNANVTLGLNTKTLGWDGVVLNWQTGYTKMNNEFTTSSKGEPITSYQLRQRVNFWYPIVGTLTFKSRLEFNSKFSYENIVRNDFLHFVLFEYGFLEKYNVSFGTGNSGPTMAGPNYENNLKFYSETSSELFLGLGADF